jgi:hypothetical protein
MKNIIKLKNTSAKRTNNIIMTSQQIDQEIPNPTDIYDQIEIAIATGIRTRQQEFAILPNKIRSLLINKVIENSKSGKNETIVNICQNWIRENTELFNAMHMEDMYTYMKANIYPILCAIKKEFEGKNYSFTISDDYSCCHPYFKSYIIKIVPKLEITEIPNETNSYFFVALFVILVAFFLTLIKMYC